MGIKWDKKKDLWLIRHRGVSFSEIEDHIIEKDYKAMLENPGHVGQMIFIIEHRGYIHVVPFVIDSEENIILKTIFPSRRYQKIYGGKQNEK